MTVLAYETEDNFFVFDPLITVTFNRSDGSIKQSSANISNGSFSIANAALSDVTHFTVLNASTTENWTFPYNHDVYDYYLLGTITAISSNSQFTFRPTVVDLYYKKSDGSMGMYDISDLNVYDIGGWQQYGFGFYEKVSFSSADNTGIRHIYLGLENDLTGSIPANLKLEFGVLGVRKNTSQENALAQILSQLQSMESSINDSLGEAADQIAGAIENQYAMSDSEDFGVGQITDQVEESLGVLTFGADTLHNFLDLFSAETVGGTQLTFPAFQIEVQGVSYNVWPDITFDLSFLEEKFGILITAVRTVTVLCVWLAVLGYLVKAKDHFINNKG